MAARFPGMAPKPRNTAAPLPQIAANRSANILINGSTVSIKGSTASINSSTASVIGSGAAKKRSTGRIKGVGPRR
eukprot:3940493-Rhodomonas_salina.1